ncbi:MAG: geranylgeranylglyceryl/heptaprenylglyceryl phosphate synthase [Bacteroidales bacterium]
MQSYRDEHRMPVADKRGTDRKNQYKEIFTGTYMQSSIYQKIAVAAQNNWKQLAVLIDPDKISPEYLEQLSYMVNLHNVDYVFVGGSLITQDHFNHTLRIIKERFFVPVVLFPGSTLQISKHADGILLLSLISGRNPELLIGNHVTAAPFLRSSGLEIISTGYMLVESGKLTSVQYISNTMPIPHDKTDIAVCTAMAGEMLGMKLIYIDAGSGAGKPVSEDMARKVKQNIRLPLIIGGGITNANIAHGLWDAGADVLVVGNALEKEPDLIGKICHQRNMQNKSKTYTH